MVQRRRVHHGRGDQWQRASRDGVTNGSAHRCGVDVVVVFDARARAVLLSTELSPRRPLETLTGSAVTARVLAPDDDNAARSIVVIFSQSRNFSDRRTMLCDTTTTAVSCVQSFIIFFPSFVTAPWRYSGSFVFRRVLPSTGRTLRDGGRTVAAVFSNPHTPARRNPKRITNRTPSVVRVFVCGVVLCFAAFSVVSDRIGRLWTVSCARRVRWSAVIVDRCRFLIPTGKRDRPIGVPY